MNYPFIINEALDVEKLKHLDHVEDFAIRHGNDGFNHIFKTLLATHDYLNGKKPEGFTINTKYDGSPSVVFGTDPATNQFFVASKSAFNKKPKLNYSIEDIEKNHKKAPGLAKKLKEIFPLLQQSVPKKGVFQGDLMYTQSDLQKHSKGYSFTPNTITYSVAKDSPEARRVASSRAGIVVHTQYKGDGEDLSKMKAGFVVDQSKFKHNGPINFIDPKLPQNLKYTPDQEKEFSTNFLKARQAHQQLQKSKAYEHFQDQEPLLLGYVNKCIKSQKDPSVSSYISFIRNRLNKTLEDLKKPEAKKRHKDDAEELIKTIADNKASFDNLFDMHKHLQDAKKPLVDALSSNVSFKHSIQGKESKPEGFVATYKGVPTKLVDRKVFSAANFEWNEKANPEDNPLVFSFGRMNPVTIGHEKLVNKVIDIARRMGAKHQIVMSGSQDTERNPLSPQQKLDYAQSAFPSTNITVASKDEPSIIHQLKNLNMQGVRHLTMVVGDDRVGEFTKLLNQYNGKEFHFKKIKVVSAGERDPAAEGTEGMSASKMRAAAKKGDWESFKKGAPSHFDEKKTKSMYNDLRKGMGVKDDVKIDQTTPGVSLSRYSRRNRIGDGVSIRAKQEIARRKKAGIWQGA